MEYIIRWPAFNITGEIAEKPQDLANRHILRGKPGFAAVSILKFVE
jgi:hypothetical protein